MRPERRADRGPPSGGGHLLQLLSRRPRSGRGMRRLRRAPHAGHPSRGPNAVLLGLLESAASCLCRLRRDPARRPQQGWQTAVHGLLPRPPATSGRLWTLRTARPYRPTLRRGRARPVRGLQRWSACDVCRLWPSSSLPARPIRPVAVPAVSTGEHTMQSMRRAAPDQGQLAHRRCVLPVLSRHPGITRRMRGMQPAPSADRSR